MDFFVSELVFLIRIGLVDIIEQTPDKLHLQDLQTFIVALLNFIMVYVRVLYMGYTQNCWVSYATRARHYDLFIIPMELKIIILYDNSSYKLIAHMLT